MIKKMNIKVLLVIFQSDYFMMLMYKNFERVCRTFLLVLFCQLCAVWWRLLGLIHKEFWI